MPLKYTGKYVRIDGKTYKEIWLPQDEYAPVEHAMSTFAKHNGLKNCIIFKPLSNGYYYRVYINKNGTPIIIGKELIK